MHSTAKTVVTLALAAGASAADAATLAGRLSYPSEELPGMIVVARDSAGKTRFVTTKVGQARYRLEVPAGTYVVYAAPVGMVRPGQVLRGAHTEYTLCGRDPAALQAGRCRSGPLVEIRIEASEAREDVDVDDWYLPDALAVTLNVISDAPPAPSPGADAVFARYPADPNPSVEAKSPDFDAAPAAARRYRSAIQRAATRGPFFAGSVAIARWGCGANCEGWALVDTASGRITWIEDPALQPLRALPCDTDSLESREDSRLLRIHANDGKNIVTQEFVWSAATGLERKERLSTPVEQFCRRR